MVGPNSINGRQCRFSAGMPGRSGRQFGNMEGLNHISRRTNSFSSIEALRQDARFGLRGLVRNLGFTAVTVLTLALGIGANTAIFSVVKAVLLDPLPYADAGRLVTISETSTAAPDYPAIDYTTVRELSLHSLSFDSMSAYRDGLGILHEDDTPEMLRGLSVDQDFFDTLGVRMQFRPQLPSRGTAAEPPPRANPKPRAMAAKIRSGPAHPGTGIPVGCRSCHRRGCAAARLQALPDSHL
jgi:hypothetical protein